MSVNPYEPPKGRGSKIVQVVFTGIGSLVGAWIASLLLPMSLMGNYTQGDLARDLLWLSAGAIFGGWLFSWAGRLDQQFR